MNTLITVAPTGAESSKADVPQLPTTLDELVDTAVRCEAAGASMIHLHIRDASQLSTGGSVHDPLDQRLTVLDAEPDSCSLTCGTTNFGDDVFLNPWPFMVELYRQSIEREVAREKHERAQRAHAERVRVVSGAAGRRRAREAHHLQRLRPRPEQTEGGACGDGTQSRVVRQVRVRRAHEHHNRHEPIAGANAIAAPAGTAVPTGRAPARQGRRPIPSGRDMG